MKLSGQESEEAENLLSSNGEGVIRGVTFLGPFNFFNFSTFIRILRVYAALSVIKHANK